jgi:hypothetical protein
MLFHIVFHSWFSHLQIDLKHPIYWLEMFLEHCYYVLPLVVHVSLPFLSLPLEVRTILYAPLPADIQRLSAFGWLLVPFIFFVLGSYSLDSKNDFCIFPGAPYYYRVIRCSLLPGSDARQSYNVTKDSSIDNSARANCGKHESRKKDLKAIRDWAMSHDPSVLMSSHFWYRDLDGDVKAAYDRCANSRYTKSSLSIC